VHFANLKNDIPGEIRRISEFIGTTIDESRWESILLHCSFDYMKANAAKSVPLGIVDPQRCDCSICRRKGAVVAAVPLSGVKIVKGEDVLSLYQFDTKEAKHYFCSVCGIYTHHKRRSNPDQYGINIGCLEGVNPYLIENVPTSDGINHPSDRNN
jgi:hypothetical protein